MNTPRTQSLVDCDSPKIDDDGAPFSCYRRMIEHASQLERELAAKSRQFDEVYDKCLELINDCVTVTAQRDRLAEALRDMACQHKCGCGHPHCNRCADDKECEEALAELKGQQQ